MQMLKSGPLLVGYENGFLRRIMYGGSEVLRMIYFALRDHNWNTITGQIENEVITADDSGFEISYDYVQVDGGVTVMTWKARINGNSDATIVFDIEGSVTKDFRKNRAGFCVLHPLDIAGQEVKVYHPHDAESALTFPVDVAPDNPFKNIRSMSWKSSGVPFALEFEGDLFETEDQRNWGDASYKTFCTPLDIPFPAQLKKGEKVFQRITFKPLATLQLAKDKPAYISLRASGVISKLPLLGVAASTETTSPETALSLLRPLRLNHYRIDLYPNAGNWVTDFSNGYEKAFGMGIPLEAVLHLTDNFDEELDAFVVVCQQNKVRLRKVLLLQSNALVTGQEIIDRIPSLRVQLPNVLFGAGTNYNFNEINKNRFRAEHADFVSFSMDPQEHATDDLTILENAATPQHLVKSAKSIYGDEKAIHLSPLTLRRRYNPYATDPKDLYIDESLKADPRQTEFFAAAWTFAAVCSLSKGNASAVTFYQTVGQQGLVSAEGKPFLVYDILKNLTPFQGRAIDVLESSDALAVQGIFLDGKILGLVNLDQEDKTVRWNETDIVLRPCETRFLTLDRAQKS